MAANGLGILLCFGGSGSGRSESLSAQSPKADRTGESESVVGTTGNNGAEVNPSFIGMKRELCLTCKRSNRGQRHRPAKKSWSLERSSTLD